jgi:hypothetical protein
MKVARPAVDRLDQPRLGRAFSDQPHRRNVLVPQRSAAIVFDDEIVHDRRCGPGPELFERLEAEPSERCPVGIDEVAAQVTDRDGLREQIEQLAEDRSVAGLEASADR